MDEQVKEQTTEEKPKEEAPQPKLEDVLVQLKTLQEEKVKLEQGLKNAQATVQKRDQKLNKLEQLEAKIDAIVDTVSQFSKSSVTVDESGTPKLNIPQVDLQSKMSAAGNQASVKARIIAAQERVEALGLKDESDEYLEIKELATRGTPLALDLAERKIARLEESKKPAEPSAPKESEEARIERLAEEKARKKLEESGLLKPEGGSPSASGGTYNDLVAKYANGEIDTQTYEAGLRKIGKAP
jgi:hypothetical protein